MRGAFKTETTLTDISQLEHTIVSNHYRVFNGVPPMLSAISGLWLHNKPNMTESFCSVKQQKDVSVHLPLDRDKIASLPEIRGVQFVFVKPFLSLYLKWLYNTI
jgi:hypothetical protein